MYCLEDDVFLQALKQAQRYELCSAPLLVSMADAYQGQGSFSQAVSLLLAALNQEDTVQV